MTVVDIAPSGTVETFAQVLSEYLTPNGPTLRTLATETLASDHPLSTKTTYATVDTASRQPGDYTYVNAFSTGQTASGVGYERDVFLEAANPGELTATLPDLVIAETPTVDFAAIPRCTVRLPITPPTLGTGAYEANFFTGSATGFRLAGVVVSPGWAQGKSAVTVTMPDLSQLPGWTADMELLPGVPVDWNIFVDDRNMPYGTPITDGKRILVSQVFGVIPPPGAVSASTASTSTAMRRCNRGSCNPPAARVARMLAR
jgi:hypothetical protein